MESLRLEKLKKKLRHPIEEIRYRALGRLLSELQRDASSHADRAKDGELIEALKGILIEESAEREIGIALDALLAISRHPAAPRTLFDHGLREVLESLASRPAGHASSNRIAQLDSAIMHFSHTTEEDTPESPSLSISPTSQENATAANALVRVDNRVVDARFRCRYLEERTRRLEGRKQWNRQQCLFSSSSSDSRHVTGGLHPVELHGHDDQYLFELGLQLRFGANNSAVLMALTELTDCAVYDLPPQIFLQKRTLMSAVREWLKTGRPQDPIVQKAFQFLERFLERLHDTLRKSLDGALLTNLSENDTEQRIELHLHDEHLRRSFPQKAIGPPLSLSLAKIGSYLDVAGFLAEVCTELVEMIIASLEPLSKILYLLETALDLMRHTICLDAEEQVHPAVLDVIHSLANDLKRRFASPLPTTSATGDPRNDEDFEREGSKDAFDFDVDFPAIQIASAWIRIASKFLGRVEIDWKICSPVIVRLRHAVSYCSPLPDCEALWQECLRHEGAALAGVEDTFTHAAEIVRAMSELEHQLQEGARGRQLMAQFGLVQLALPWMEEASRQRYLNCLLAFDSLKSGEDEIAAKVLRSLLMDFSNAISRDTLISLCTSLQRELEQPGFEAGSVFRLVSQRQILSILFTKLLWTDDTNDRTVELLSTLFAFDSVLGAEAILSKIEPFGWILMSFEADPVLHTLSEQYLRLLCVVGDGSDPLPLTVGRFRRLFHRELETQREAFRQISICLAPSLGIDVLEPGHLGAPFEDICVDEVSEPVPLRMHLSVDDAENLIQMALEPRTDTEIRRTALRRLQSLLMSHVDSVEHAPSFETRLEALCSCFTTKTDTMESTMEEIEEIALKLETLYWMLRQSEKTRRIVNENLRRFLGSLGVLCCHPAVPIRKGLYHVLYLLLWHPLLTSEDVGPYLRYRLSQSYRFPSAHPALADEVPDPLGDRFPRVLCFQAGATKSAIESRRQSQLEALVKLTREVIRAGTPLALYKDLRRGSLGADRISDSVKKTLAACFEPLVDFSKLDSPLSTHSQPSIEKLREKALNRVHGLALSFRVDASGNRFLGDDTAALVLGVLELLAADERPTSSLAWIRATTCLLSRNALDGVHCRLLVDVGLKRTASILESNSSESSENAMRPDELELRQSAVSLLSLLLQKASVLISTPSLGANCSSRAHQTALRVVDMNLPSLDSNSQSSETITASQLASAISAVETELQEPRSYAAMLESVQIFSSLATYISALDSVETSRHTDGSEIKRRLWDALRSSLEYAFLRKASLKQGATRSELQRRVLRLLETLSSFSDAEEELSRMWRQRSLGFSWLSRCLRDSDAEIRSQTSGILVHICRHRAQPILPELLNVWPEFCSKLLHTGMDSRECPSVRRHCLEALLQLLGHQGILGETSTEQDHILTGFISTLRSDEAFWSMVMECTVDASQDTGLKSACCALVLKALDLDLQILKPNLKSAILRHPLFGNGVADASADFARGDSASKLTESEMQRIVDDAALASGLAGILAVIIQSPEEETAIDFDLCLVVQGMLNRLSGFLLLYQRYFYREAASLQRQFCESLHGLVATLCFLLTRLRNEQKRASWELSLTTAEDTGTENSLCHLLASILQAIRSVRLRTGLETDLIALCAHLMSDADTASNFLRPSEEATRMVRILVEAFQSAMDAKQESEASIVCRALGSLLAFHHAAKTEVIRIHVHSQLLRDAAQDLKALVTAPVEEHRTLKTPRSASSPVGRRATATKSAFASKVRRRQRKAGEQEPSLAVDAQWAASSLVKRLHLLSCLANGAPNAAQALMDEGGVALLSREWERISASSVELYSGALKLLTAIAEASPIAYHSALSSKENQTPNLYFYLIRDIRPMQLEKSLSILEALAIWASHEIGAAALTKHGVVAKCGELLDHSIGNDAHRLRDATFELLEHLCAHDMGRRAVLSAAHAKPFLKRIHRTLQHHVCPSYVLPSRTVAAQACLRFVRNLAFSARFASHFLSRAGLLEELCSVAVAAGSADLTQSTMEAALHGLEALAVLVASGEKAKAAVKGARAWEPSINALLTRIQTTQDEGRDARAIQKLLEALYRFQFLLS